MAARPGRGHIAPLTARVPRGTVRAPEDQAMELAACPSCGAFSDSEAATCSECGVPFPEDAAAVPVLSLAPLPAEPVADVEPAQPGSAGAAFPPPAFEASPETLSRIDDLEAQIAKKPQAPALYLQLSKVYAEAQRMDLATGVVERFLAVDPGNAYMRHKLAQLTGTPEAVKAPAAVAPAAAAAARAAAPSGTVSFQAGLAQRPAAPSLPHRGPSLWSRYKVPVIGVLAVLAAATAVKLWFFPSTRLLVSGNFRAHSPVWAPNSKQVAFLIDGDKGTQLAVYDLGEKRFRSLGPASAWDARSFSWSPDGTRIAYTARGDGEEEWGEAVKVVDVASGRASVVAAGSGPAFTADGQSLLMTCSPDRPAVYDEDTYASTDWTPRFCTVPATGGTASRGAAAEGGGVVSPLLQKALYERWAEEDVAPSAPSERLPGGATAAGADEFTEAVIAGGARNLAEANRDMSREVSARKHMERRKSARGAEKLPYAAEILVGDIGGGDPVVLGGGGRHAFPAWTPDGERIQFATDGAQGIEIWTMNAQGGDRKLALGHGLKTVDPSSVTLSHDGKYVFFVAAVPGDPGVAKMMTGESPADLFEARVGAKEATRLTNTHPFKQRFAVSPDGKYVVYEVLQDLKLIEGAQKSELWLMRR
jgi:hypothetical protein